MCEKGDGRNHPAQQSTSPAPTPRLWRMHPQTRDTSATDGAPRPLPPPTCRAAWVLERGGPTYIKGRRNNKCSSFPNLVHLFAIILLPGVDHRIWERQGFCFWCGNFHTFWRHRSQNRSHNQFVVKKNLAISRTAAASHSQLRSQRFSLL